MVMNTVYSLNARPLSDLKSCRLPETCIIRNSVRKRPVSDMSTLRPMELSRNFNGELIVSELIRGKFMRWIRVIQIKINIYGIGLQLNEL